MKKYEITYASANQGDTLRIEASSILGALEKAHRIMQKQVGFKSNEYKLTKAVHVYSTDRHGGLQRSEYDIPGGPNPVVDIPDTTMQFES